VVLPGIAAAVLVPHLGRSDEAYPNVMTLLPSGLLGLVFVALSPPSSRRWDRR